MKNQDSIVVANLTVPYLLKDSDLVPILKKEIYNPIFTKLRYHIGIKKLSQKIGCIIANIFIELLVDDLIDGDCTFHFRNKDLSLRCGQRDLSNSKKPVKYNIETSGRNYALLIYWREPQKQWARYVDGAHFFAKFIGRSKTRYEKKIKEGHIYK